MKDKFDKLFTEEVIKSFCHTLHVEYHHHDSFSTPPYLEDPRLSKAICVVYSQNFGGWRVAFNNDGTISFPFDAKGAVEEIYGMMLKNIDKLI